MNKLKQNDLVVVLAGKDKGKTGEITRILDNDRVFVSGINMVKRHTKGNPQAGQPGGIMEKEAPLHISNIAIFNRDSGKADRVGIKTLEDGKRIRVYKSIGEQIDS